MDNKKLASVGNALFNYTFDDLSFSLDEAIGVIHSLVPTNEQLRLLKNIMKSRNIYFPNTNELNEAP